MTTHRCDLAEALLYSPVSVALARTERDVLDYLLRVDERRALDPAVLSAADRKIWPKAGCLAGIPAVIAGSVWRQFNAFHRSALTKTVDAALEGIVGLQLVGPRSGLAVLDRRTGAVTGVWRPPSVALLPGARPVPGLAHADLSRIWTSDRVRDLVIGPLAAWPVETTRGGAANGGS